MSKQKPNPVTMVRMILPGLGLKDILDDLPFNSEFVPDVGDIFVWPSMEDERQAKRLGFERGAYKVAERVFSSSYEYGSVRVLIRLEPHDEIPEWADEFL